jgi:ribulose-phosphate 3-epimerase
MALICPTVLADTPKEFARQLARVKFASRIQIDITDGVFAPSDTINLNQVYFNEEQATDLHLMIAEPRQWLETAISLHPHMVILHAEARGNLLEMFSYLQKVGIKAGVAILPETTVAAAAELIAAADHILIFGGHLGYMGGAADLDQLEKVAEIRAIKPEIEIGWDGGANGETVRQLATSGVDVINVGSAIMKTPSPEASYEDLLGLID